jgi:uncharacterized RDD family membrane protein YckC
MSETLPQTERKRPVYPPKRVKVATFVVRTVGFAIDAFPTAALALVVSGVFGFIDWSRIPPDPRWNLVDRIADTLAQQGAGIGGTVLAWIFLLTLYGAVFELTLGVTPGKHLLGLRLTDRFGERPYPGRIVFRNLVKAVSVGGLGLGALWAAFDGKRMALHDRMSGVLVERPAGRRRQG